MIGELPKVMKYLAENPSELSKLPGAVGKAIVQLSEDMRSGSHAIANGLTTDNPAALEAQAQAESTFLANFTTTLIGAGIGKVAVEGGKVVVKESAKTVAKSVEKSADNILLQNAGRIDPATGKPILDMNKLTNAQKGTMGELFGESVTKQIIPDGKKLSTVQTVGSNGIDDLYKVNRPDVDYVIVEYKFNTAKQGATNDGLQASQNWITGGKRLENAVGKEAEKVSDSLKAGRAEVWLINVMPDGSSKIKVLDPYGKPKNIDTSKIIIPNKSYNGAQL